MNLYALKTKDGRFLSENDGLLVYLSRDLARFARRRRGRDKQTGALYCSIVRVEIKEVTNV